MTYYLDECVALAVINFQYGGHVSTAVTIIRCTEYGNHLLFLYQRNNVIPKLRFSCQTWKCKYYSWIARKLITCAQLNPSITSWCALAISFKLFAWLNCSDISCIKYKSRWREFRRNEVTIVTDKNNTFFAWIEVECISSSYLAKGIPGTTRWYTPTTL